MSVFSVTAPTFWWRQAAKSLDYSTEKAGGMSEGGDVSFLSCVIFDITGEGSSIMAESSMSTTFVDLDDVEDLTLEGTGRAMVKSSDFSAYIMNMPTDEDVTVEFDTDGKTYSVSTVSGAVSFKSTLVDIIDDDMTPTAFRECDGITVDVLCDEFEAGFRRGSAMTRKDSGYDIVGNDPFSGSCLTVSEAGVQVLSLTQSSSEVFIPKNGEFHGEGEEPLLLLPSLVSPGIAAINEAGVKTMTIGIGDKNKILHVDSGCFHMTIQPLNASGKNAGIINYTTLSEVFTPAWENRVVSVSVSPKEFLSAIRRASTVDEEKVVLDIADTSIIVSTGPSSGVSDPFTQEMSCSTQWLDDGEHNIVVSVNPVTLKNVVEYFKNLDKLIFHVSLTEQSDPWALTICDDINMDNDMHNFFLVGIS